MKAMLACMTKRVKIRLMQDDDTCPGCGIELSEDDAAFFKETGFYECPACLYEGCDKCMPCGRNVLCPDCEGAL
jgi:hypothetical protein